MHNARTAVLATAPILTAALATLLAVVSPAHAQGGWTAQPCGTSAALRDVDFVDASNGWIVGASGTILRTTDGGGAWTPQSSGTTYGLRGVAFLDAAYGLAVGEGGTILRTLDGGAAWTVIRTDWMDTFTRVFVLDASHAWAVGSNAIFQPWVARSTDGGASWSFHNFYIENSEATLTDVCFTDPLTGFAAAAVWDGTGAIVRTTDGGATWSVAATAPVSLSALEFPDPSNGIAAGLNGLVMRTTDGGATWTVHATGTGHWVRGLAFANASIGTAVGDGGTIVRTLNGGVTWQVQESGTNAVLRAVDFTDALTGTAVGDNGVVLRTVSGGAPPAAIPVGEWIAEGGLAMRPNLPNPFRGTTIVSFDLPATGTVRIEIFDPLGRRVRTEPVGVVSRGAQSWSWDGTDDGGRTVTRGVYLCRIHLTPASPAPEESTAVSRPVHGLVAPHVVSRTITFLGR